jgi:hypothetical protein
MDEAAFVYPAKRCRYSSSDVQERSHFHGSTEERFERLAPGVVKEQHGPPMFAHKR